MSHALGKENIFIFYIPQPNEQWTWQGHVEKQITDATCFDDRWLHRIARTQKLSNTFVVLMRTRMV